MVFKDINSGFYVLKRPMQYACTHDEVKQMSERNGIVKRAIYNFDKSADANDRTLAYARQSQGTEYPVVRLMPPVYAEASMYHHDLGLGYMLPSPKL